MDDLHMRMAGDAGEGGLAGAGDSADEDAFHSMEGLTAGRVTGCGRLQRSQRFNLG